MEGRRDAPAAAADDGRGTKPEKPALRRPRHAAAQKHQRDLAHSQRAVADDETATAHLREQRGCGSDAVIDAHPSRIGTKFGDNQRRDHRGKHLADRRTSRLQKHRNEGGQHMRQCNENSFHYYTLFREYGISANLFMLTARCLYVGLTSDSTGPFALML